jgi:hypothetical protein
VRVGVRLLRSSRTPTGFTTSQCHSHAPFFQHGASCHSPEVAVSEMYCGWPSKESGEAIAGFTTGSGTTPEPTGAECNP